MLNLKSRTIWLKHSLAALLILALEKRADQFLRKCVGVSWEAQRGESYRHP